MCVKTEIQGSVMKLKMVQADWSLTKFVITSLSK